MRSIAFITMKQYLHSYEAILSEFPVPSHPTTATPRSHPPEPPHGSAAGCPGLHTSQPAAEPGLHTSQPAAGPGLHTSQPAAEPGLHTSQPANPEPPVSQRHPTDTGVFHAAAPQAA